MAHCELVDQRDKEKQQNLKQKIEVEKKQRDKQLQAKNERIKKEAKDNLDSEVATLKRLQAEMDAERKVALDKKRQEREYFQKMIEENKKNEEIKKKQREKERQEDVNMQKAYAAMLDKQEKDR